MINVNLQIRPLVTRRYLKQWFNSRNKGKAANIFILFIFLRLEDQKIFSREFMQRFFRETL